MTLRARRASIAAESSGREPEPEFMSPRAPTDKPLGAPLLAWFERNRRALPWRETSDPYRVWLSEVMLQQTRVDVVIPYYERFLERFPSLESLASAREEEVLALWSGLGYYRRARSLHAGARTIVERHSGRFPRSADDALEVPGVGPYTAGAVLSIAYNLPEPVVDGNVERVLTRVHALPGDPRKAASARVIRELARAAIPRGKAARFNQALMELGALVCLPRSPRCGECPLSSLCEASRVGQPERFPELPPERATVQINLHAAVIVEGETVLLVQVAEGSYLRGLWLPPLAPGAPAASDPSEELERSIEDQQQ